MRSSVAILTGGGDRPYALGLASSLIAANVEFDFIGSDDLESPELRSSPQVRFLNLRGDMRSGVSLARKVLRLAQYYAKLVRYSVWAEPRVFHILWNNKIEWLDRTLLMGFYKLLGKRVVLTVHNVNVGKRDGSDSLLNRTTLWIQYRLTNHLFVHTELMRSELQAEFGVLGNKISVIPFGINATVPESSLSSSEARSRLGLRESDKAILFFGNIARYKGLEHLVEAMHILATRVPDARLIVAGRPKGEEGYWLSVERRITNLGLGTRVVKRIEFVPDEQIEVFFKAADLLALPYLHIFQSGVLFLGYNFGLPVVVSDVGSLAGEVIEGETGFSCPPGDPLALAQTVERYFDSDLHKSLGVRRAQIRRFAAERYSWTKVAAITCDVYRAIGAAV